jgi:hypothetical protein
MKLENGFPGYGRSTVRNYRIAPKAVARINLKFTLQSATFKNSHRPIQGNQQVIEVNNNV